MVKITNKPSLANAAGSVSFFKLPHGKNTGLLDVLISANKTIHALSKLKLKYLSYCIHYTLELIYWFLSRFQTRQSLSKLKLKYNSNYLHYTLTLIYWFPSRFQTRKYLSKLNQNIFPIIHITHSHSSIDFLALFDQTLMLLLYGFSNCYWTVFFLTKC